VEVNRDSLPLHVLGGVPEAARPTVAQLLRAEPELARAYGGWLSLYEPIIWQEIVRMSAEQGETLTPDLRPLIDLLGVPEVLRQIGRKQVIAELGPRQVLTELGVEGFLAGLQPEQREELLRRLQQERQGNSDNS
jgi:hypothetical protein